MPKFRIGVEPKDKVKRKDIEFDFRDVQKKNPKLEGKTPLYLFIDSSIPKQYRSKEIDNVHAKVPKMR